MVGLRYLGMAWAVGVVIAGCQVVPPTECADGYEQCGKQCVALQVDSEHCGGCGIACSAGELCVAGECVAGDKGGCPGGLQSCDGACRDLSVDPANCGACGNACAAGEVCSDGECSLECGGGTTRCGDRCVDVTVDPSHCGGCGTACPGGEVCDGGTCALSCSGGTTECGGGCVDTKVDPANCGGCGMACAQLEGCVDGTCGDGCPSGTEACGGSCVDTSSDVDHCGGCGNGCSTFNAQPQCVQGGCQLTCDPGFDDCDGNSETGCETSIVSNAQHCGACGQACGGNTECGGTTCVAKLQNTIAFGDYVYATLDDIPPNAAYGTHGSCQSSPMPMPSGWQLVPEDNAVVQNVIAPNTFSTHCILFENGVSYGGQAYSPGDNCGCSGDQCLKTDGNGNYWTSSCSRRILIRRKK